VPPRVREPGREGCVPVTDNRSLVGGALVDPIDLSIARPASLVVPIFPTEPTTQMPTEGYLPIGRNQRQRHAGTCLAHTYGAAIEGDAVAVGAHGYEASIMDAYFGGRWIEGNGAEKRDGGIYPSKMISWFEDYGVLTDVRAPYDPNAVTTYRPDPRWAEERALSRATFIPIPTTTAAILAALEQGRHVAFCHFVHDSIFNVSRTTGEEEIAPGAVLIGHARLLVGWRDGWLLAMNWWENFGVPHPEHPDRGGFSWIKADEIADPRFLYHAAVLAVPPPIEV